MKTLCLLATACLCFSLCAAEYLPVSESFSKNVPLADNGEFVLHNTNGSVQIVGWDKNEVSVEAEKRAASAEDLARIQINVDASEKRVAVETKFSHTGWLGTGPRNVVNYTVHVPASAKLHDVQVVNSDVTIKGVHGEIDTHSVNGTVRAEVYSAVTISTVNGNIDVRLAPASDRNSVYVHTVNGGCRVLLPTPFDGSFDASTVNGKVVCNIAHADVSGSRKNLQGTFGNKNGPVIDASAVNGSVTFESTEEGKSAAKTHAQKQG